jgi:hypothetical protein
VAPVTVNATVGVLSLVGDGTCVMPTLGPVASTVNVVESESVLPAASAARTVIVWLPSASGLPGVNGEVQVANAPVST